MPEDAIIAIVVFGIAGLVTIIGMVLRTVRHVSADRVKAIEANTTETSALHEQVHRLQQTVDSLVWAVESNAHQQRADQPVIVQQQEDGPPPFNRA